MCLSSYPHPNVTDARCWTMSSNDLDSWSEPQPKRLKGSNITVKSTGSNILIFASPQFYLDGGEPLMECKFGFKNVVNLNFISLVQIGQ